jgi:ABC-type uncharacterized transport system auxiliary subunit
MKPDPVQNVTKHPYSVCVGYAGENVRDARSRNPNAAKYFGNDNATSVGAQAFMDTVIAAVTESGLFQKVVREGVADYRLDVNIISEIQPAPGMQMKSTIVTAWKLTHNSDKKVVADELIEKSHKATPGSFVGIRTAVEGAVRDTIEEGIKRLSRPGLIK